MRNALSRAAKFYAQSCFDSVTYIGVGVWDGRASRALGFSFIGIAAEDRAQKLLAEGAQHIFVDYSDSEAFLSAFHANRRAANRSPVTKQ